MAVEGNIVRTWRLHIKTDHKPGFDPGLYCVRHNWAGIGWALGLEDGTPSTLDEYIKLGQHRYADKGDKSWLSMVDALARQMQAQDLCWTRIAGTYYLGRITGPWQYLHGTDAENHDLHNVRPCTWVRVGLIDAVPGAVERAFIPARTLQRITDAATVAYSNYLYATFTNQPVPACPAGTDVFGLFSPLEHEDIAALYLQSKRAYAIIPSSAKSSTEAYECVFVHRETGEKAVLQVKSGGAIIQTGSLKHILAKVFVVDAVGAMPGETLENVEAIPRATLLQFALAHKQIMPERIKKFMDWAGL